MGTAAIGGSFKRGSNNTIYALFSPLAIDHRTPRPVARRNLDQRWQRQRTFGNSRFTSRFKGTSGGQRLQRWNSAFDRLQRPGAVGFQIRDGVQQAAGVGMRGGLKDVALGAQFHQTSRRT